MISFCPSLSASVISNDIEWPSRSFRHCKLFEVWVFVHWCSSWQDFNRHSTPRSLSMIAEPLIALSLTNWTSTLWVKKQYTWLLIITSKFFFATLQHSDRLIAAVTQTLQHVGGLWQECEMSSVKEWMLLSNSSALRTPCYHDCNLHSSSKNNRCL